jgi:hypothetical protein
MPGTDTLPAVDDCVDLYLRIHDHFGTTAFSPNRLADSIDHDDADDGRSLAHLLELLVAYGLLDRPATDRFRIRCAPDDELEQWRAATIARTERLRRLVDGRADTPTGDDTLSHDGATFTSVRVDADADFDAVERAIAESAAAARDGVVLRSPGDFAAAVQQFADRVCERGIPSRDWRFEKVTTDLVGDRKDALEFRLYLRIRDDGAP